MKTKDNEKEIMHEVDVFGLFSALKNNGYAKLSDHYKK